LMALTLKRGDRLVIASHNDYFQLK
jgi:hypothetical protein